MERFDGYIFSKLNCIGTRSEGPIYFLQSWNYSEALIVKKVWPWQKDSALHKFLGKKVTIEGRMSAQGINYENVSELKKPSRSKKLLEIPTKLELDLLINPDTIVRGAPEPVNVNLTLSVYWPYRSIWPGICPTSQIYDFIIEQGGKVIWQWSADRFFIPCRTPVEVPGGSPIDYTETWVCPPGVIGKKGALTARAIFIASGQEVSKNIKIK